MSFLEHLDEFRRRLVQSGSVCSNRVSCAVVCQTGFIIFSRRGQLWRLIAARVATIRGVNGDEKILSLVRAQRRRCRAAFSTPKLKSEQQRNSGNRFGAGRCLDNTGGLFTDEPVFSNSVVQKACGFRLILMLQPVRSAAKMSA